MECKMETGNTKLLSSTSKNGNVNMNKKIEEINNAVPADTLEMDEANIARALMEQRDYQAALHFYNIAITRNSANVSALQGEQETCKMLLQLEEEKALRTGEMFKSYAKRAAKCRIYRTDQVEEPPVTSEDLHHEQEILIQAYVLLCGWGTNSNANQAFQYFQRARNGRTSETEATFRMAVMLVNGEGIAKNEPEGLKLLQETALHPPVNPDNIFNKRRNVGVAESRYVLGKYFEEKAVANASKNDFDFDDPDFLTSSMWYELGHRCSHGMSSEELGLMYQKGIGGVPKSDSKAEWYFRSAIVRKWNSSYLLLANLLISQREIEKAKLVIENGLETDDLRIRQDLLMLFADITILITEYNKQKEGVEEFEEMLHLSKEGIPFCERIKRMESKSNHDIQLQRLIHEISFVESINVNIKSYDKRKDMHFILLEQKDLDYLCWCNVSSSSRFSNELLEMVFKYCQVLKALARYESDPSSLVKDNRNAAEFVSHVADLLKFYLFELRWKKQDLLLLYTLLQEMLGSDIHVRCHNFATALAFCLAEVGAKVDIQGLGFKYLMRAWTMYPDELQLSITLTDYYIAKQEYVKAYMIGAEALERFANHVNLLFSHGRVCFFTMNHTVSAYVDFRAKAIQNLIKFLYLAPVDHPQVPETYYILGVIYFDMYRELHGIRQMASIVAAKHFYRLGEFAERQQLACLAPYRSMFKDELNDRLTDNQRTLTFLNLYMNTNVENSQNSDSPDENAKTKKPKKVKNINEDQNRILLVVGLRNSFQNELEKRRSKRKPICQSREFNKNQRGKDRVIRKLCRKWPITVASIFTEEKVWEDNVLMVTVIDEALSGFGLDDIHIIAEDEARDVLHIVLHHFKQDAQVQKKYGFGRKIQIYSPESKVKEDGEKIIIVNDPNKIICGEYSNEVLCRFCLKPGAKTRCSQCKWANYCTKECQEFDWKVLKHKKICCTSRPWDMKQR